MAFLPIQLLEDGITFSSCLHGFLRGGSTIASRPPTDDFSVDDVDSHRARGARDRAHGCLDAGCVGVLNLRFGDLADLRLRELADLVLVRTRRTGTGLATDLQSE